MAPQGLPTRSSGPIYSLVIEPHSVRNAPLPSIPSGPSECLPLGLGQGLTKASPIEIPCTCPASEHHWLLLLSLGSYFPGVSMSVILGCLSESGILMLHSFKVLCF